MRIGICGGTFDPFHGGHLHPVLAASETMEWDRVIYVPAFRQPFKSKDATASPLDRFAMAVLATEEHELMYVSKLELQRGDISYTVDTLEVFRAENPDATLDWIIGDDNLAALQQWRNLDRIFELANFVVLTRGLKEVPEELRDRVADPDSRPGNGAIAFARNATVPVSSTEIRRRVRAGEPIDELVDPRVSHYIHHYRLYKEDNT
jgi:nicotinate-nucleotide adenylyltransferase